jgi:hypothetical protein
MNYTKIDDINYTQLSDWYYRHEQKIKWLTNPEKFRQTSLQYAQGDDVFLSGIGQRRASRPEQQYNLLNPAFVNTPFEDVIKKYNLIRTRLIWLQPNTCYSLHKDNSFRLHIPLVTNEDCKFIFLDDLDIFHLPAGGVYKVDASKTHSFCNFSSEARLHLLGCVY